MADAPLPQHGNATTCNLEAVLRENLLNSRYYKSLHAHTFLELVDEVYNEVTHVEPWMSGNARGPSTAFCILLALFDLKLSTRQVRTLLQHGDSPYIRALGFLYLRYVGEPRTLWTWFQEYLKDPEELVPSPDGKPVTVGVFARELLLDQFYFETLFPRIPEVIARQLKDDLARAGLPVTPLGCAGQGGSRRGGEGDARRPASVKASLAVSLGQRAPHVAGGREDGRGFANVDPGRERRAGDERYKGPPSSREEKGPRAEKPRDDRRRSRSRERDRRRSRSRSRERRRSRSKERRHRSRSRSRDRSHRHRSRDYSRGRDDGRSADAVFGRSAPVVRADVGALRERY